MSDVSEDDDASDTELVTNTMAAEPQTIGELVSFIDDGYKSEGEVDTRKLVADMNRKKKKSGGFQSMGLSHAVYKGIIRKGYKVPTPIQRKCIPLILSDKDVVAMARTGSGKTAAFLIPLFEKLQTRQDVGGARALLLAPTRELALQTLKFVKEIGKFTSLRTACVLGGDRMEDQFSALHENPDVIIATPGRLMHILVEMELKLSCVQYVVFDEADRLFELGFQEQLHEILHRLPEDRQTLLFSATLPKQLVEFAKAGLNDPTLIRLDVDSKLSDQLKLAFLHVRLEDKLSVLLHLLRNVFKENEQTVVFVATKHHVEYIKEVLRSSNISCSFVYSSLDQTARKINIAKFRNKKTMNLVVTDVAARGLDIPMLDNVINFSFPPKSKLFVHRVGRVARAGRTGTAYSLVSPDELAFVIDLHLFLGRSLNLVRSGKKYGTWDSLYGKVAQVVIDEENATLQSSKMNSDVEAARRVSENAFKQYLKSRPAAASESIKRAKAILKTVDIGIHPIYDECVDVAETARMQLLSSVRGYKPSSTIFEIGATAKSSGAKTMKKTRRKNTKFVEKYKERLKERRAALESANSDAVSGKSLDADNIDIKETFRTVIHPTSSKSHLTEKMLSGGGSFRDEEFCVRYKPSDHFTESGLSLSTSQSTFAKEASSLTLDLMGDEDVQLRRQKTQQKVWDRRRKRFVNAQDRGKSIPAKKIRTESGAVISATYKKNIYAEWKKKSMPQEKDDDGADGISRRWRGGRNQKNNKEVKSEIKKTEQILKQRKLNERKRQKRQKRGKPKRR
ncbi:ATP-dependent RNA helicase DDX54-like [Clavelina lepadiformis]|uniref:ATP-dependent RNA helicase DDX54-like n=1 Tax=Clavelina lepadiformis TaxID=159417 RepID=UPI0040416C68